MNGPLALAVLTNTTRRGASRFISGSKSAAVMSGPGQVELRDLAVEAAVPDQHHEDHVLGAGAGAACRTL